MTMRTLLLTPWYIPIEVLHWQDAIKMVYEETVDVVVEYDEEVRSLSRHGDCLLSFVFGSSSVTARRAR